MLLDGTWGAYVVLDACIWLCSKVESICDRQRNLSWSFNIYDNLSHMLKLQLVFRCPLYIDGRAHVTWWLLMCLNLRQLHLQISCNHYSDVTIGALASQITSLAIVYSSVYSGAGQRKHQSSASLAFVRGFHRSPVNSPHKGPVTRKMFPFHDVIMMTLRNCRVQGK